jgi:transcriptional regulator with GAF, ATPase, and Fis domain
VIVLLGQRPVGDSQAVWRALGAGASDVLIWEQVGDLGIAIRERLERWRQIDALINLPVVRDHLVGESVVWKSTLRRLVEAARYSAWPLLLSGETGTGKELAARVVHTLDLARNRSEIVVLDCSTIVPELSGSELFGHERGAYTGAVAARDGAFALADGGTLFLDEVGELPLGLQVQLLRALQERSYKRVGSSTWRKTDFRLVSATNRDLLGEAMEGSFRLDLYHRIAAVGIDLPPLRDRIEDILPLARHFIRSAYPQDAQVPDMDEAVELYLLTRTYPGNVRELGNLVHRILARHVGIGPITVGDIPPEERLESGIQLQDWCEATMETVVRQAFSTGLGLREIRHFAEETAIRVALEAERGSVRRAAQRLAITDRALQKRRAEGRRIERDEPAS